jgi:hypothetical protein
LTPLQRGGMSILQLRGLGTVPSCLSVLGANACGEMSLSVPLTLNSNPLGAIRPTEDGHVKPTLSLIGSLKLDQVVGVVSADATADRYFRFSRQDRDIFKFWLGAAFNPAEAWSLYLGYRPTLAFTDGFQDLRSTFHDVVGGVKLSAPVTAALAVTVDLNVTHRDGDPDSAAALIPGVWASLTYSHYRGDWVDWSITAKPTFTFSSYDNDVLGRERHDIRVGMILSGKWYPWPGNATPLLRGTSLALQAALARNDSNLEGKSFTVWDIGPVLTIVYGKAESRPPPGFRLLSHLDTEPR